LETMNGILIRWLFTTLALLLTSYLVDGIQVKGFFSALLAAALLGILNAIIRPVLILLTLPINILTLGLFTFVINALLLMMVSGVVSGFHVTGFWAGFWGALVMSLISWGLNVLVGNSGRVEVIDIKVKKGEQ
jgi:putative membrane protein